MQKTFAQTLFDQHLAEHHLEYISDVLRPEKCVIAGGFALQTITQQRWKSDIDLYVTIDYVNDLVAGLRRYQLFDWKRLTSKKYEEENSKSENTNRREDYDYSKKGVKGAKSIKAVYETRLMNTNTRISDVPVQIIVINGNSVHDAVDDFDFDFCKVMYDGQGVTTLSPESVREKKSVNNKTNPKKDNSHRVEKYTQRGFEILDF